MLCVALQSEDFSIEDFAVPSNICHWFDVLHLLQVASTELNLSNEENRELQLEVKMKTELCNLLEEQNEKANELIQQLEKEIEVEKLSSVIRKVFPYDDAICTVLFCTSCQVVTRV